VVLHLKQKMREEREEKGQVQSPKGEKRSHDL
jgi:hypothetical protein